MHWVRVALLASAPVILIVPIVLAICVTRFGKFVSSPTRKPLYDVITAWVTFWGVMAALVTLYFLYDEATLIEDNQNAQA